MNPRTAIEPTLTEVLQQATLRLQTALPELDARREAEALVLSCLQLPRSALFVHDEALSEAACARLEQWLQRRSKGEPLAYLRGEREFWSLPLQVDARVLVPRPETELLVERALRAGQALSDTDGRGLRVLDLGTGSGAIALAIVRERPDWIVTATDRSGDALQVAIGNAARLGLDTIEFIEGEWFAPLGDRQFDLILSNPPYVAADDPLLQGDSLRHEPRGALTPGADALGALRSIVTAAPTHLAARGVVLLEHGATQGQDVRALLETQGFCAVRTHRDLAGHERVSEARGS